MSYTIGTNGINRDMANAAVALPDTEQMAESVGDYFSSLAPGHMEHRWTASHALRWDYEKTRRALMEEINPQANERILEIGCGSGTWTGMVAERAKELIAVDISDGMIAEARKATQGLPVDFIHSDFLAADIPGKFDKIFSSRAIEYMEHGDEVVAKITSLLKPGGTAVIVTKNRVSVWRGRQRLTHWLLPVPVVSALLRNRKSGMGRQTIDSQYLSSADELTASFEATGLEAVKTRPVTVRPPVFAKGFFELPIVPDFLAPPVLGLFSLAFKLGSILPKKLNGPLLGLSESYSITMKSKS